MDYNEILKNCGYCEEDIPDVLSKIANLEEFYSGIELVEFYNDVLLNIKCPELLEGIIKLSGSHKAKSTFNILLNILSENDSDEEEYINLRAKCAKMISEYKDSSALPELLKCLNDKNENYKVRLACADALGRIGDKYAVEPLLDVVKDEDEKSVYVKETAAFALGLIGDTSAIEPLVNIMEQKQGIWDKFSFLKEKIVEVLGKLNINNAIALRAFKTSLMDSSPMVRINTIEALMNSEYEEAPELIHAALHDDAEEVQRNALIALYNLEGRDILDEVISLPGYSEFLKEEAKALIDEYEECK